MAACTPPEELVGYGALLQYWDKIAEVWVTIGGTKDLEFPEDTFEAIDTTSNDSPGGYKTNIPAPLAALGQVSYTMNFRPAQFQQLASMKANRTVTDWRIVLMNPQQTFMSFCAWLRSIGGTIPMETLVQSTIGLNPTGPPTHGNLIDL
jgi:hypothetical protein